MPGEREEIDEEDNGEWDADDEDDGYVPCPHCGETMLEAADHCPACDRWITSEDRLSKPKPTWVVVVILILLALLVLSALPL